MRRGGKDDRDWFINTMKRFNGHKRLILGNHDHLPIKTYAEVFEKVVGTGRWIEGLLLSHYPVHPESMGNAPANVHGHVHNNQNNVFKSIVRDGVIKPYINVSIEVIDYKPVSLEEVQQMVRRAIG
jgi:calcineurin-like phosphoesterase family protein